MTPVKGEEEDTAKDEDALEEEDTAKDEDALEEEDTAKDEDALEGEVVTNREPRTAVIAAMTTSRPPTRTIPIRL